MAVVPFSPQDPQTWQVALMQNAEGAIVQYKNVFTAQQGKISELDAEIQQLQATLAQKKPFFAQRETYAKAVAQRHVEELAKARDTCKIAQKNAEHVEQSAKKIVDFIHWLKSQMYPGTREFLEKARHVPGTARYLDEIAAFKI